MRSSGPPESGRRVRAADGRRGGSAENNHRRHGAARATCARRWTCRRKSAGDRCTLADGACPWPCPLQSTLRWPARRVGFVSGARPGNASSAPGCSPGLGASMTGSSGYSRERSLAALGGMLPSCACGWPNLGCAPTTSSTTFPPPPYSYPGRLGERQAAPRALVAFTEMPLLPAIISGGASADF